MPAYRRRRLYADAEAGREARGVATGRRAAITGGAATPIPATGVQIEDALDAIIAAQGIIVEAFNTRKGHRAEAARLTEAGVEKKLTSKGVEGLRAQMATWDGLSGDSGMWFNPVFVG